MQPTFFEAVQPAKKGKPGEPLWLIAYVDLTTNLMALFILMLAMSHVDTQKFDAVSKQVTRVRTDSLDELQKKIDGEIRERHLDGVVSTSLGMFGLLVEFGHGVMFESASDALSEFAKGDANKILDILAATDPKYLLSFEGHTDDTPLRHSTAYRDNWALSCARGVALLRLMRDRGVEEKRMSIAGYAAIRPKVDPAGKHGPELEAARSQNRRVVVRVTQ